MINTQAIHRLKDPDNCANNMTSLSLLAGRTVVYIINSYHAKFRNIVF